MSALTAVKIILGVLLGVLCLFVLLCLASALVAGRPKRSGRRGADEGPLPGRVMPKPVRIDLQRGPSCSGFSAAFVTRQLTGAPGGPPGADGIALYQKLPKFIYGGVLPKHVVRVLEERGFRAEYRKGTPEALKEAIAAGDGVILLLRTRLGRRWLHYVPAVGYEGDTFLLADSLVENANCAGRGFNRRIDAAELPAYWDTRRFYMPLHRNTYILVKKEKHL